MMKMLPPLYPIDCLHALGSDFAECIASAAQAKTALVGPVVLAAMSAAVHGVLDIYTPSHQVMPTSLYAAVIAASGMRKSTVVKYAFHGFKDFESAFNGSTNEDVDFREQGSHPYILEDTSESGIESLYTNGAKASAMVMDEGGILEKRLDNQRMCQRFDGSPIRIVRYRRFVQIQDTRTVFCMTIQDAVFERLLKGKQGSMMVASGLIPRILVSYATDAPYLQLFRPSCENPNLHAFHERVCKLTLDYKNVLQGSAKRAQIRLSPEAQSYWDHAKDRWIEAICYEKWRGMDAFLHRAGEHALRIAAVLQWFTDPQPFIQLSYMQSAVSLVDWHLNQALMGFGPISEEIQQEKLGDELYEYMIKKFKTTGQDAFLRVDLMRKGPANLRKSVNIDLAIDQLLLEDKVVGYPAGDRKRLVINTTPKPKWSMPPMRFVEPVSFPKIGKTQDSPY